MPIPDSACPPSRLRDVPRRALAAVLHVSAGQRERFAPGVPSLPIMPRIVAYPEAMTMKLTVLDHPLVDHKLTVLRDKNTPSSTFRQLVSELVTLEAYEATRDLATEPVAIETPVASTTGRRIAAPRPMIVPILRAGLGMLDGMTTLLPTAEVGFLGMKRDEKTLDIITYANRLPDDLSGRQCFLLDPMLATGGTLVAAIHYLHERGAKNITSLNIIAAPEGIERLKKDVDPSIDFHVIACALDDHLNGQAYIVPGLGDAGDRLYGVVD